MLNHRYQILQTLARGGFGQTYLAVDTHLPSQRRCVIKQLKAIAVNPQQQQQFQARFEREAAILEALGNHHPQIPHLYAYFADAGTFYIVQEYIEGLTLLETVQKQGPLSEAKVTEILLSLLSVLEYVHQAKIIHRDLKPENIILRTVDARPVLIDFGAVKEAMGCLTHGGANVKTSVAIGTPGYMPPEQAAGRPLYSSDLYSLALTAVYLLSGKTPQELEIQAETGEILWRKTLPQLHSNLGAVLDRALRYPPGDRFPTAAAMSAALQGASTPPTPSGPFLPQLSSVLTAVQTLALPPLSPRRKTLPIKLISGGCASILSLVGVNLLLKPSVLRSLAEPLPPIFSPVFKTAEIPIFPPGIEGKRILNRLGKPTYSVKGFYPHTRAIGYKYSEQVNLSYIIDNGTQKLRQSEMSVARSLPYRIVEARLRAMLATPSTSEVMEGLQSVYDGRAQRYSFELEDWEGIVKAEPGERIYIAVWEADFH